MPPISPSIATRRRRLPHAWIQTASDTGDTILAITALHTPRAGDPVGRADNDDTATLEASAEARRTLGLLRVRVEAVPRSRALSCPVTLASITSLTGRPRPLARRPLIPHEETRLDEERTITVAIDGTRLPRALKTTRPLGTLPPDTRPVMPEEEIGVMAAPPNGSLRSP